MGGCVGTPWGPMGAGCGGGCVGHAALLPLNAAPRVTRFCTEFCYKVENKLGTGDIYFDRKGKGRANPCFTLLSTNQLIEQMAGLGRLRAPGSVRACEERNQNTYCETHTKNFFWCSESPIRDMHMLPIRYAARVTAYAELSKPWLHRSILEAKPRRGWGGSGLGLALG